MLACVNTIDLPADLRGEHFDTFWQQCIDILNYHSRSVNTSLRALDILRTMRQHVEGSGERHGEQSTGQHQLNTIIWAYNADGSVSIVDRDTPPIDFYIPQGSTTAAQTVTRSAMPDFGDVEFDRLSEGWLDQCLAGLDWPSDTTTNEDHWLR